MLFRCLFSFLSTCLLLMGAPGDFIRQIQTVDGVNVIYDIPVYNDDGEVLSKPLEAENAIFQLYALDTAQDGKQNVVKLDEATVGTYMPSVEIVMISEDPNPVPRTRADRPYGVRVSVSGIESEDAPVTGYNKKMNLVRSYALYDGDTYLPTGQEGEFQDEYTVKANGSFVDTAIFHMLPEPAEQPTKGCGEESFTVFTREFKDSLRSEVAKGTIQIWPVADCQILNLEEEKLYHGTPANVGLVLRDLYPKSETKAQIYPGQKAPGTVGTVVPSSTITYDTHQPQNANLVLTDLEKVLEQDGWYTLEVLTKTPFNDGAPEILASVSFRVQRSLRVNGMMVTFE